MKNILLLAIACALVPPFVLFSICMIGGDIKPR